MWRWDEVMGGEERIDVLFAMSQVCVRFSISILYCVPPFPNMVPQLQRLHRWQEQRFTLL